jgi:predicted DNA-binding transcriptional regulator AlpA
VAVVTGHAIQPLYDVPGELTGLLLSPALALAMSRLALYGVSVRQSADGVTTDRSLVADVHRVLSYARTVVIDSSLSVSTADSASELAMSAGLGPSFGLDLITTEEVRRMLACGESNVSYHVARGHLHPVKTGKRSRMFVRADVERYLQESAHRRSA